MSQKQLKNSWFIIISGSYIRGTPLQEIIKNDQYSNQFLL